MGPVGTASVMPALFKLCFHLFSFYSTLLHPSFLLLSHTADTSDRFIQPHHSVSSSLLVDHMNRTVNCKIKGRRNLTRDEYRLMRLQKLFLTSSFSLILNQTIMQHHKGSKTGCKIETCSRRQTAENCVHGHLQPL